MVNKVLCVWEGESSREFFFEILHGISVFIFIFLSMNKYYQNVMVRYTVRHYIVLLMHTACSWNVHSWTFRITWTTVITPFPAAA